MKGGEGVQAVIVCALELEYSALCARLSGVKEEAHRGNPYEVGTLQSTGEKIALVVAGQGQAAAAAAAERAIGDVAPRTVLFVGIAGGLRDVVLGDVVLADAVMQYERAKATAGGMLPRIDSHRSTSPLLEQARRVARRNGWRRRIPRGLRTDDPPKVMIGPIAAGEKVVASQRSAVYRYLKKNCSQALAVEMEGYGFLEAAWRNPTVDALVVRGVSDLLAKGAENDSEWQPRAAAHAAAFAVELLAQNAMDGTPEPVAGGNAPEVGKESRIKPYLELLDAHVTALPRWFPPGVDFSDIVQTVTVLPEGPEVERPADFAEEDAPFGASLEEAERSARTQTLAWFAAFEEFEHVLLLGGPGSGKTWALRSRISAAAREGLDRVERGLDVATFSLPVLASAQKLEQLLGDLDRSLPNQALVFAETLVKAMPDELLVGLEPDLLDELIERVATGGPVELLIDGFDEIGMEGGNLGRSLGSISSLLSKKGQRVTLTSRPAATPASSHATSFHLCQLEPFGPAQQEAFARSWFDSDSERANRVVDWLDKQASVYRTPLLVALLCSIVTSKRSPLPSTLTALWDRALLRLASGEGRSAAVSESGDLAQTRMQVLESIAGIFVNDDGIREAVPIGELESQLAGSDTSWEMSRGRGPKALIEDLVSTGILQVELRDMTSYATFLHSGARDFLLARWISCADRWREVLPRIWSQPEWEPVIAMVGALMGEPTPLLRELRRAFAADPLNVARVVAGEVLANTTRGLEATSVFLRDEIIRELIVNLCSPDEWTRDRAASLLRSIEDAEVATELSSLVHPSVPTDLIVATLRTLGAGSSPAPPTLFTDTIGNPAFIEHERQAALQGLVASKGREAHSALAEMVTNDEVPGRIRATAALYCWTELDDEEPMASLIKSDDEESLEARRLAVEAWRVKGGASKVLGEVESLADPYCRAVLGYRPESGPWEEALAEGIPVNAAMTRAWEALDLCGERAGDDALYAAAARCFVAEVPGRALWKLTELTHQSPPLSGVDLWNSLLIRLPLQDANSVAAFLCSESKEGPPAVAKAVARAIEERSLDALVERHVEADHAPADAPEKLPHGVAATAKTGGAGSVPHQQLSEITDPALPEAECYRILRANRRALPEASEEIRLEAVALTHSISCGDPSPWVEAAPALAEVVEARLSAAGCQESLMRLRLLWPGRAEEAADVAARARQRTTLAARAEALLLLGRLDEAFVYAMSSIGAADLGGSQSLPSALGALFASSREEISLGEVWRIVYDRVHPNANSDSQSRILDCWLRLPNASPEALALASLPAHVRYTEPEVAAMEAVLGSVERAEETLNGSVSWFNCKKALWMLDTVEAMRPGDEDMQIRLGAARAGLARRAEQLAERWPLAGVATAGARGNPEWFWEYTRLATVFLQAEEWVAAARVFRVAVQENPQAAMLRNNLGFCLIPTDLDEAASQLEEAAQLNGRAWDVNIANRMLIAHCLGDSRGVLDHGDLWLKSCSHEGSSSTLWDIDSRWKFSALKLPEYVVTLALRAAELEGDIDAVKTWNYEKAQFDNEP